MSDLDRLSREVIFDPQVTRGHGLLDPADAQAEGQNPLCGDEVVRSPSGSVTTVRQSTRSLRRARLCDLAGGHLDAHRPGAGTTAGDVAALPKEALLDELGIPLTPVRLKCAILGLGVLEVALHKATRHAAPAGVGGRRPRPAFD